MMAHKVVIEMTNAEAKALHACLDKHVFTPGASESELLWRCGTESELDVRATHRAMIKISEAIG